MRTTLKVTIGTIAAIAAIGTSWTIGANHAEREFRTIVPNGPNMVLCDMSGEPDCWPLPDNY